MLGAVVLGIILDDVVEFLGLVAILEGLTDGVVRVTFVLGLLSAVVGIPVLETFVDLVESLLGEPHSLLLLVLWADLLLELLDGVSLERDLMLVDLAVAHVKVEPVF